MNADLPWTCILFDVDGTLVDSGGVVIRAFHQTLDELGLPQRTDDQLRSYVGPPLARSFEDLGLRGTGRDRAVATYRAFYGSMFLEPAPYPGIPELLEELTQARLPLATATSKQERMASAQLEHLGLSALFTVVAGATPDPSCSKATVARDALRRLEAVGVDTSRPVLVGDRQWDVEGGAEAGVPVIGAGWGYAHPGELDGALAVAPDPAAARDLLVGGVRA